MALSAFQRHSQRLRRSKYGTLRRQEATWVPPLQLEFASWLASQLVQQAMALRVGLQHQHLYVWSHEEQVLQCERPLAQAAVGASLQRV
mmetsp:Transcript_30362/g.78738  ORF Transcript_30362/g.78738 Transcript_30362/m.78738 type:complete len:89 (-) Transcript_30362:268-534(-)